jgi:transketolase
MEKNYKELAREARIKVLTMIHRAGTSHIASNFSAIDLATVIYANLKEGDEVFWSKGWAAASVYYFLAQQKKFPKKDLEKFPNAPYLALAETLVNGVLVSGGSMAHGLPVALGLALGKKLAGEKGMVYCIMGDGEMQEGTIWESAQIAQHHKLDNLTVIIDYNKWCAMGQVNDVCNMEPLQARWEGFNWNAVRIDGHHHGNIERAILRERLGKPLVIIAETVKGKGVSFMENHLLYHYKHVDDAEYEKALAELNHV